VVHDMTPCRCGYLPYMRLPAFRVRLWVVHEHSTGTKENPAILAEKDLLELCKENYLGARAVVWGGRRNEGVVYQDDRRTSTERAD
jgi:hypothetical protein